MKRSMEDVKNSANLQEKGGMGEKGTAVNSLGLMASVELT